MTQDSKKLINNYLIQGFSVKKIKNKSGKWNRVISITGGYVRDYGKDYKWDQGIDSELVVADLMELVTKVFGCSQQESMILVMDFIKSCPALHPTRRVTSKLPPKKTSTPKKSVAWFGKPKKY